MTDPCGILEIEPWLLDLERSKSVIYVLDQDFRILYCNQAWDEFAKANEGQGLVRPAVLGQSALQVSAPPLRTFYETMFCTVLESGRPCELDYECSSPDLYRVFHMRVLPVRDGNQLLIANALAVERPHGLNRPARAADLARYVDAHGFLHMCSHCRCTRRMEGNTWDWVPSYLNQPPAPVSHGLCPVCMMYYYPEQWEHLRHRIRLD